MRTLVGVLTLMLLAGPLSGPQQVPTTRVTNCTNGACHASQLAHEFLHGPTAAGACNVCHIYVDEAAHSFQMKRTGAEMCNFCHIGKTDTAGLHVHDPVQKGECLSCHDPHGSTHQMMLRGKTPGETCLSCHNQVVADRTHVHTPISQGDCLGCHRAHVSMLPKLLVAEGRSLCLRCHEQVLRPPPEVKRGAFELANTLSRDSLPAAPLQSPVEPFIHDPVTKECTQCHNPGRSRTARRIR